MAARVLAWKVRGMYVHSPGDRVGVEPSAKETGLGGSPGACQECCAGLPTGRGARVHNHRGCWVGDGGGGQGSEPDLRWAVQLAAGSGLEHLDGWEAAHRGTPKDPSPVGPVRGRVQSPPWGEGRLTGKSMGHLLRRAPHLALCFFPFNLAEPCEPHYPVRSPHPVTQ